MIANEFISLHFCFLIIGTNNLAAQQNNILDSIAINKQIDSFLFTLHNKDAQTGLFLELPKYDSTKKNAIRMDIITTHVTSINMGRILNIFPKKILLLKLMALLNDPERDWYANLLLFDISKVYSFSMMQVKSRDKWLTIDAEANVTYKAED